MHIMVREKRTSVEEWIPLDKVAELRGLTADEIEWAVEEHGECEAEDYIDIEPD